MKKMVLRAGLFAGLAMSVVALASCGESKEVKLKDADGKEYSIVATEDSDAVAKALILSAMPSTTAEKTYAIGADATLNATIASKTEYMSSSMKMDYKASFAATIGSAKYSKIEEKETGYSDADINNAVKQLKDNLGALATIEGTTTYTDYSVDAEKMKSLGLTDEMVSTYETLATSLKGKKGTGNVKAFIYQDYAYVEAEASLPKEMVESLNLSGINENNTFYGKKAIPYEEAAPEIVNALCEYQENGLEGVLTNYGDLIKSKTGISLISDTNLKVNETFFKSKDYKNIVEMIKALGVKISSVRNNDVTFDIELTGARVKDVIRTSGDTQSAMTLGTLLADEVKLFNISFTWDVANQRLVQVKISTEALDTIVNLIVAAITSIVQGIANGISGAFRASLPQTTLGGISGSINIEINFKYNGNVNAKATPDASKTYVE